MLTPTDICDTKPVSNVVRLVSGRNITELNQSDINYAVKFYYDCINQMKLGKIKCLIAPD